MIHSVSLSDPTLAYPHFNPCGPGAASLQSTMSNYSSSGSSTDHTNSMVINGHSTNGSCNGLSPVTSAAITALAAAAAASVGIPPNVKDSRWLTLEVCRQFQRNQCSRDENECKFAHPPTHVDVQNGRVICCYDSIKGKCQRRDPPCKYLHPPQHLREQLMQNGRNNMIIRNMQLQLFQHQLMTQSGILHMNPSAAVAAAVVAAQTATSPGSMTNSPVTGVNGTPNSLLYPGPGPLTIGSPAVSSTYPILNIGFTPFLNAITSLGLPGGQPSTVALHLPSSDALPSTDTNNTSSVKRPALTDNKSGLPLYLSSTNGGAHVNGTGRKLDSQDNGSGTGGCMMTVNGSSIDSTREMNGSPHSCASALRSSGTTGTDFTTALYALQHAHVPRNATTVLNMHPAHHAAHSHTIASLQAAPLNAAMVNGGTSSMAPAHYSAVAEHAGFFQPGCHIEIPPYPFQ